MEEFQKVIVQMLKANMDQQQKFEERPQLHHQKFEKDSNNFLWSYINNK